MTLLSPVPTIPPVSPDPVALLLADKRSPATRRAYASDLAAFFHAEGKTPAPADVQAFFSLTAPEVALRLATYKGEMLAAGLAEATVNRRLAAVRSLLKFSHRLGLAKTDGRGLVDSEKVTAYRDTRGIDLDALRRLMALPSELHGPETLRTLRDTALLRLLAENALRRAEVCALNVGDFSAAEKRLMVLGKGRGSQKIPVTLSTKSVTAVEDYLITADHAEDMDGPLFRNLDRRHTKADPGRPAGRLASDGLHDLVGRYGQALGTMLTPHKLRHSAITAALDASDGNVRKVQKLSRHADLRTLTIYDDNRADAQGEMTGLLSGLL
jgi:integrase/recombinase XerC